MTAIAGFWRFGGGGDSLGPCERMLRSQEVYGPGPARSREADGVAMGRRLFARLPEDRFDAGPVSGGGGRFLLVADIRIDGRDELCRALGIASEDAARLADPALLMRAWERWEEEAPARLAGDFAFALWDGRDRRLWLGRDVASQRPLHYHRGDGFFAFASMPKGLHALPELPPRPDRQTLTDFLALLPEPRSRSFFEGVSRVSGAHLLEVRADGERERRYWSPPAATLRLKRPEDYAEALREQLDRAVEARLRGGGGHVASHLSAGLDSSAVTATAARLLAGAGGRVTAFTAVPREGYAAPLMRGRFADEGPLAAEVACLYPNVEHVRVSAAGRSPLDALDRNFFLYERPYLNLCNGAWVDAINDAAKAQRLEVMLGAVLGNATFSYHGLQRLPQLLKRGRLLALLREGRGVVRSGIHPEGLIAAALGPFLPRRLWRAIMRAKGRDRALGAYSAIHPALAADPALLRRAAERGLDLSYRPRSDAAAERMMILDRVDFGNYNKGMLAGWGIDFRDPGGDRRLIDFCFSVPVDQYLRGGLPRALARTAFADRLPAALIAERRSGYQGADWHESLVRAQPQLVEEVERIGACPGAGEMIDVARLRRLGAAPPAGAFHSDAVVGEYRLALLRGVSTGHFLRKATGSNR